MGKMITIEGEVKGYINKGISSVEIDDSGNLVITLTDGSRKNLGRVKGEKGDSGMIPVYILTWNDELTENGTTENKSVLYSVVGKTVGEYKLLLDTPRAQLVCIGVKPGEDLYKAYFTDGDSLYTFALDTVSDLLTAIKSELTSIDSEVLI